MFSKSSSSTHLSRDAPRVVSSGAASGDGDESTSASGTSTVTTVAVVVVLLLCCVGGVAVAVHTRKRALLANDTLYGDGQDGAPCLPFLFIPCKFCFWVFNIVGTWAASFLRMYFFPHKPGLVHMLADMFHNAPDCCDPFPPLYPFQPPAPNVQHNPMFKSDTLKSTRAGPAGDEFSTVTQATYESVQPEVLQPTLATTLDADGHYHRLSNVGGKGGGGGAAVKEDASVYNRLSAVNRESKVGPLSAPPVRCRSCDEPVVQLQLVPRSHSVVDPAAAPLSFAHHSRSPPV